MVFQLEGSWTGLKLLGSIRLVGIIIFFNVVIRGR
jgi:hypothetical protein